MAAFCASIGRVLTHLSGTANLFSTSEQTTQALDHKLKRRAELLPGGPPGELLGMDRGACAIRKGAVWWLRQRLSQGETVLLAVMTPNYL